MNQNVRVKDEGITSSNQLLMQEEASQSAAVVIRLFIHEKLGRISWYLVCTALYHKVMLEITFSAKMLVSKLTISLKFSFLVMN